MVGRPAGLQARMIRRLESIPLRVRLVAIVAILLTAALALTSLTTAYLMERDLVARVDRELRTVAAPVASQALDDLRGGNNVYPSSYAFILQGPFGQALSLPTGITDRPELPDLAATSAPVLTGRPFTVRSTEGDTTWRFVAGRVSGGNATFAVGVPLEPVRHTVARLLATTGAISVLVLALALLLGWYAVRRAFRPLRRIEDTAAAIAAGDLTQRVPERQAADEVTSLSRSLNVMLGRIERAFTAREASEERMRQFVADASHELRTPLATVRGYAELYRQGAVTDRASVDGAMARIEAESERMSGLVEDLLVLARLDEEPTEEYGEVDLTVLAADAVADGRARAPERVVRLVGIGTGVHPTPVAGSEARLRQVVTNLLANALHHTPPGTPVEVAVGVTDGEAILEVRDHGPGIPDDLAGRVFERFYRTDPSRGRSQGGGNGLGLAIVAAIVAAHNGRVGVAATPGGGATFVVRLPTANSQQLVSRL